jgi:hypothetical protein
MVRWEKELAGCYTTLYAVGNYRSEARRKDFECFYYKDMMNV